MKDKNVAGVMALILGTFGVHRFYLGQTGLGVLYCVFFWTGITAIAGVIDAIILFSMDQDRFDLKYNWKQYRAERRDSEFDRTRRQREEEIEKWERRQRQRERTARTERRDTRRRRSPSRSRSERRPEAPLKKQNPYKVSGIKKYKDYDFDGAIEDFEKALEVDEKDVATHFNLACAYSLNEEADQAFQHLDRAVELGFNDFDKIKQHDALAFVRIQPQYDDYVRQGYRLVQQLEQPQADLLNSEKSSGDLLEQLKKLGELRERGLLTETEFTAQKKKLLG
ncbi:MAG: NINE protein [Saprospiraceae bacterium]